MGARILSRAEGPTVTTASRQCQPTACGGHGVAGLRRLPRPRKASASDVFIRHFRQISYQSPVVLAASSGHHQLPGPIRDDSTGGGTLIGDPIHPPYPSYTCSRIRSWRPRQGEPRRGRPNLGQRVGLRGSLRRAGSKSRKGESPYIPATYQSSSTHVTIRKREAAQAKTLGRAVGPALFIVPHPCHAPAETREREPRHATTRSAEDVADLEALAATIERGSER